MDMEAENNKPTYQIKFDSFIEKYKSGQTSGEEVGETIAHLAQEFANYNMMLAVQESRLSKVSAEKVQSTDENTGKPISVSKADVIVKSTSEYDDVRKIKTHIENLEQFINALKYLQKGILNEYSHMNT